MNRKMESKPTTETLAWTLPRPRKHRYIKGGFPLHFERRVLELYGFKSEDYYTGEGRQLQLFSNNNLILHPFGGMAEYGLRVDINPDLEPHIIADAHHLPFKSDVFAMVIVDPPYSDSLSRKIYGTGKLKYNTFVGEAVRVTKAGGYIVLYHVVMLPRPKGTFYDKRIYMGIRIWHRLRCVNIFRKKTPKEIEETGL